MAFTFEDYLKRQICGPVSAWYDPAGSSSRAVVTRMRQDGYFAALKWEVKSVLSDVKYFFTEDFEGINTPLAWFVNLTFLPVLAPVAPFLRTRLRYHRALEEYRQSYESEVKRKGI